jgi:cytochrome c oxidase subunit 1
MFGRYMNDTLGKIHFWGTFLGFNGIFIPLFVTGMLGDHRRIFDHTVFPELSTDLLKGLREFATYSLLFMLAFQPLWLYNFVASMFWGKVAEKNPWKSNTLEWTADSPPPHGNWAELPTVHRGPYEYSVPGRSEDYWPQNAPS